jgi:hypothetical protein
MPSNNQGALDVAELFTIIRAQNDLLKSQGTALDDLGKRLNELTQSVINVRGVLASQDARLASIGLDSDAADETGNKVFSDRQLTMLNPRFRRNFLPNDSAAVQKLLVLNWHNAKEIILSYSSLISSGFRVFSQGDEDGTLLRILSHVGAQSKMVVEIGSNCDNSDVGIPENLSTNLIVNHGWHGVILEIDAVECERMRYFFARDSSTKHFHRDDFESPYFSPIIQASEVTPSNINELLMAATKGQTPDLLVIDIDGGDYAVIESMSVVKPRVLVVEFEKRFRDRYRIVQNDRTNFGGAFPQSGAASLTAWTKLLAPRGYILTAISTGGFNAYFVREDVADGKVSSITAAQAFDEHPIFSKVDDNFWLSPDDTWLEV